MMHGMLALTFGLPEADSLLPSLVRDCAIDWGLNDIHLDLAIALLIILAH
jgi:hypothetical protein